MAQIENLPLVLTGLGLTASILYYTMTLRNANKTQQQQLETRQAQLLMQIHSQWNSTDFGITYEKCMHMEWKDYDEFNNKYMSIIEESNTIRSVSRFFEGIGVLVHSGLLDIGLVDDLFSGEIVAFWEKIGPTIIEFRKRNNWPQALEWVEYLYNQVKPVMEDQHPELKEAILKYQ